MTTFSKSESLDSLADGQWFRPKTLRQGPAGTRSEIVRCPRCGHMFFLRRSQTIARDGRVVEVVACPRRSPAKGGPCAFNDFVFLKDWTPKADGPQGRSGRQRLNS